MILQGWSHGPQMGHRYPGPDDQRYPMLYLESDIYDVFLIFLAVFDVSCFFPDSLFYNCLVHCPPFGEFAASPHAHLLDVLGDGHKQLPAPFNAKWCGASSAHTMLLCLCFRTWNYWSFLILLTVTSFAWWSCWKNAKLWSQTPLPVSHLRCPAPRLCLVSAQAQQMWAKESEFRAFLQSTGTHFAHGPDWWKDLLPNWFPWGLHW